MPNRPVVVSAEFERYYSVTLNVGANAATSSGDAAQNVVSGSAMTTVTCTAAKGYQFPETSDLYNTANGVTVARTSDTVVTVSGTPTADTEMTIPDATPLPAAAPTISGVTGATLTYGYTTGGVSVTAAAAEGHSLSYQWYSNTTNSNAGGTAIKTGGTSASYAIPTGKNAGPTEYYYCVVTAVRDDNGLTQTATSDAAAVTIVPRAVGLKWRGTSFPCDGKAHAPTAAATGLVEGDTCTVTVEGEQTKAGKYTATATALSNPNYKLPKNATQRFTITAAGDINDGLRASEKNGVISLQYGEVSDANSYVVYFHYCGTKSRKPLMTVRGAKNTSVKIKRYGGKKINRRRSYTLWVEAKKGKKVLKTSVEVHAAGSKHTGVTNAKSVKVKKSSVTLKKGKKSAIQATVKKTGKGHLHKSNRIPQIRYFTSNKKVATVNNKGQITARGKGTCQIKVMALNGVCTYVAVTVK